MFTRSEGYTDMEMEIPCSRCHGCRLEKSRIWAVRCMHEAEMNKNNCFLTLTYSDENLPEGNTIVKEHLQQFWKRLRKDHKFKYFACGEYGDTTGRAHYHAILFGYDPSDKVFYKHANGNDLFKSKYLEKKWGHGHVTIGNCTFESCAYVARYVMKKNMNKLTKHKEFRHFDYETGEIIDERKPEFQLTSQGLGSDFYDKYVSDIYYSADGELIQRGNIRMQPPKYYEKKFEQVNPERLKYIKAKRRLKAERFKKENTLERLATREKVKMSATKKLIRTL